MDLESHKNQFWVVATQIFLGFSPLPQEIIQLDEYFSDGLVQPPPRMQV